MTGVFEKVSTFRKLVKTIFPEIDDSALIEMLREVKKRYGERGYIVLTDMNKFDSYIKYGIKILRRNQIKLFTEFQFSGQKNSDIGAVFNFVDYRNSSYGGLKR